MKSLPLVLFPALLIAGCSSPQPTSDPSTATTTVPIVATTPTPTTGVFSTPTPVAVTPSPLDAQDTQWVSGSAKCFSLLNSNKLNAVHSASDVADLRADMRQSLADYNQIPLPTKFTKADFYLRHALEEQDTGLSFLELGYRTGNTQDMELGKPHYVDAGDLASKALDEIDRISKGN